jgi:hypothetical protein
MRVRVRQILINRVRAQKSWIRRGLVRFSQIGRKKSTREKRTTVFSMIKLRNFTILIVTHGMR